MNKLELINRYNIIYKINKELIDKKGKENFNDVIDYNITLHALSLLKNLYLDIYMSNCSMFDIRSIIESLALKEYYKDSKVSKESEEFFKSQYKILRYNHLKLDNDKEDYLIETSKYKDKLTSKELNKLLKLEMPSLLDSKFSYFQLVKKYLTKELFIIYRVTSQYVHPSDIDYVNKVLDTKSFYKPILEIIDKLYIKDNKVSKNVFTNLLDNYNKSELKLKVDKQVNLINKVISKVKDDYFKHILDKLKLMLIEFNSDYAFKHNQQLLIKTKVMYELFGYLIHFNESSIDVIDRYKLVTYYSESKLYDNLTKSYDYTKAYNYYKKLFKDGLDKEKFISCLINNLGLLIDSKGIKDENNKQYTFESLADILINKCINKDKRKEDYLVSQMYSHCNGCIYYDESREFDITNLDILDINISNYLTFINNYYKDKLDLNREIDEFNKK